MTQEGHKGIKISWRPSELVKLVEECSICYSNENKQLSLECNHHFCLECVGQWYINKWESSEEPTCPICRKSIEFVVLFSAENEDERSTEVPPNTPSEESVPCERIEDRLLTLAIQGVMRRLVNTVLPLIESSMPLDFMLERTKKSFDECVDGALSGKPNVSPSVLKALSDELHLQFKYMCIQQRGIYLTRITQEN